MRFTHNNRKLSKSRVVFGVDRFQNLGTIKREAAKPTIAWDAVDDQAVTGLEPLLIVVD